ncbi:histidine phosphatase family protein [Chloroflexota bacterium]
MVRWYLVRHGRTVYNRDGRIQGHNQNPLDEEGLVQAGSLRNRLTGKIFSAAFSSDLTRAIETARIILNNRQIALDTSPDLRELDYGLWEGMNLEEIETGYKDEMSRFVEGDHDFAPPEGESVTHLLERTGRFVEQVKDQLTEGNLLVVCHGGSLRGLVVHLLELPADRFWSLQVDQASLSIVDIYPNRAVLNLFNDTSHLGEIS